MNVSETYECKHMNVLFIMNVSETYECKHMNVLFICFWPFYYKNTHHCYAFDHFPYHTFYYHGKKYHQLY